MPTLTQFALVEENENFQVIAFCHLHSFAFAP